MSSPVYWSDMAMQSHKLDIRSELRDLYLAICRRCEWPSPNDPTKGGKVWTGKILIAALAQATGTGRNSVKRRLRALKRAGMITHEPDPMDIHRHEAWIFTVQLENVQRLWAMRPVWRRSTDRAVSLLRDWRPWKTREKQGKPSTSAERHPQSRPSAGMLEDAVWGLAQAILPDEVRVRTGGHERQVRSLVRCTDNMTSDDWQAELELVKRAITILSTTGSRHGTGLAYALERGRKMWHPRCWPKRVAEARRVVDEHTTAQVLRSASTEQRVVPFFGDRDLADVLPELQLRYPELMVDTDVRLDGERTELWVPDVVRGNALLELAGDVLQTVRATVLVGAYQD